MATLQEIWDQARSKHFAVDIDTDKHESVIYKGIKLVKDESGIKIFSTETDFYKDITDEFVKDSFMIGVNQYLKKKYLRKLDEIEKMVKYEMNNNKNHKRFAYLKAMRETYLNKYNEVNT